MESKLIITESMDTVVSDHLPLTKAPPDEPAWGDAYSLGMFGFGMSMIFLGTDTLASPSLGSSVLMYYHGLLFAGVGQSLAGVGAFLTGNNIGGYIFFMYSLWWYGFCIILGLPQSDNNVGVVAFNCCWLSFLIFSTIIFSARFKEDTVGFITGVGVCLVNISCSIERLSPTFTWHVAAAVFIIFSGLCGVYCGAARLINTQYKRDIIPIGFSKSL